MYGSRSRAPAVRRRSRGRPTISRPILASRPAAGFDRFDLRPELRRAIEDAGFSEPRPIQVEALPAALEGRDVLGLAQTGTGKTAAFALPILQRLMGERRPGPRALIVAPTRELASQVHAELLRLGRHTKITAEVVFGGVPIPRQVRALARRPDVVVACPGRLLDLLGQKALRLDAVEVLVLDEADHMFDMGFLPDVRRILRALPERRQNLLFSATMPKEIRGLADQVLQRPVVVELANARPAATIEHALLPLAEGDKHGTLERLLRQRDCTSAIVFLRTKHRAKRLAHKLDGSGLPAVALQGNMSQPQRERALAGFKSGRFRVLVATDIAARGLDIAGVSHVVNFDVPNTPDAYTHRIGRTGRSECSGRALTFVTPADADAVRAIEKRLGKKIDRAAAPEGRGGRARPEREETVTRTADSAPLEVRSERRPEHRKGRAAAAATPEPRGERRGRRGDARRDAERPRRSDSQRTGAQRTRRQPEPARQERRPEPVATAAAERPGHSAPFGVGVDVPERAPRPARGPHSTSEPRRRRRRA